MDGNSPYPPGYAAPQPGSGPPPPGGPGYGAPPPPANFGAETGPKRRRTGLLASGVALAVLLGVAALVLSIIRLTRDPESPPPPESGTAEVEHQELFVDDADKALCEVIAPLMKESDEKNRVLT